MKRGDVHWLFLRKPDKRRPVVILTRTGMIGYLSTVTVASVTSTRRGAPTEVHLDERDGLPQPCAINLHQVFTIPRAELGPHVASLAPSVMARVDRALVLALGVGEV